MYLNSKKKKKKLLIMLLELSLVKSNGEDVMITYYYLYDNVKYVMLASVSLTHT